MNKIKLIIICLFFIISKFDAQVTVGTENLVDKRLPIEPSANYNYTQTIYLSSEIYTSGNITSLSYYATPTTVISNANNWTIYLGHTTKSVFSSTSDWVSNSNLIQVFSGVVTLSGSVATIIFDTPFAYNGIDNLVVAIYENTPSANSPSDDFYCTAANGNRALSLRAGVNSINPSSPATASSIVTAIANITFGGISHPGPPPTNLTVLENTTNSANLSWTESGTATKWNIQWDTSSFVLGTGNIINEVTANPFNLTGLDPGRYYQFYVQANYDASGVSYWAGPYSFYTIGIPQFKFHLAFEDATGAKDTLWFIFDSLGTPNYDPIFGEEPVLLSANQFEVYIESWGGTVKTIAGSSNNSYVSTQIKAQNYIYPLTMSWDSSLFFNNNLPFTINTASLDNDWFFFQSDGSLHHQYNMLTADSDYVNLPTFTWGSQSQFPFVFSFGYDPFLSTNEKLNEWNHLNIYPNPVGDYFYVDVADEKIKDFAVKVLDAVGNVLIYKKQYGQSLKLDVSLLSKGIYIVEVFTDNFSYREKIIKY